MKSLAVRLTLLGLFVIATGAAAYLFWTGEMRARNERDAARAFDAAVLGAERELLELRAAQQGYVAAGQGDQFWASKVAELMTGVGETLRTIRSSATSSYAQSAIDNAASALQDFEQMDTRARDYARNGQKLLASDLIFADGLEITGAAAASLRQARSVELQSRDAAIAAIRRDQLFTLGGAAAVALLVTLSLVPRSRAPLVSAAPVPETAGTDVRASAAAGTEPALDRNWSVSPPKAEAPAAPGAALDLPGVASLCTDLARVEDTRALPAILERAAGVLDAPGIVLWIADPDGRELNPIVTHGYPPQVVSRLGIIRRDAENATASAFRTSLLQTVRADAAANGAIAAPLLTPAGCVGVMAAEVRHGGETDSAKLAAATIIAAQLATLAGPPAARAHATAETARM